jgi:predicted RNA-binding protein with PIN domain
VKKPNQPAYLLVDGYNIIFAWEELKELAQTDIGSARDKLMDILSDYQGYTNARVILVYDAYKVEGGTGEVMKYHNIHVVYTKEAETADQYIEKVAHEMGKTYDVTVATSDGLEQIIIQGQGCSLLSARELKDEIAWTKQQAAQEASKHTSTHSNYLFDQMPEEMQQYMEDVRLGRKDI